MSSWRCVLSSMSAHRPFVDVVLSRSLARASPKRPRYSTASFTVVSCMVQLRRLASVRGRSRTYPCLCRVRPPALTALDTPHLPRCTQWLKINSPPGSEAPQQSATMSSTPPTAVYFATAAFTTTATFTALMKKTIATTTTTTSSRPIPLPCVFPLSSSCSAPTLRAARPPSRALPRTAAQPSTGRPPASRPCCCRAA